MTGAETFLSSAAAYERHVGRYGAQLAAALIDFAGVERGMRALDVGCGTGALTAVLAQRLGPASVSAADPSEAFLEACLARVPGVEVVVAEAEQLPFCDGAFARPTYLLFSRCLMPPGCAARRRPRQGSAPGSLRAHTNTTS